MGSHIRVGGLPEPFGRMGSPVPSPLYPILNFPSHCFLPLVPVFRTDGTNRTSSKLLGRRQTVALLSNCDIKRFQNCPVRMEGAQRTISEMSGRFKTVAQPFHAIGTEKRHFDLPRPRREGQKPRVRPTEYPGDRSEPRPIGIPIVLIGFRHTRGRPP